MTSRSEVPEGSAPERLRRVLEKVRGLRKELPASSPPILWIAFDVICADLESLMKLAKHIGRPNPEVERQLELFEAHLKNVEATVARQRERRRAMN